MPDGPLLFGLLGGWRRCARAALFRAKRGRGPRLATLAPRRAWLRPGRPVEIYRRARPARASRLARDLAIGAPLVSPPGALCRCDACRADCPSGLRLECPARLGLFRFPGLAWNRIRGPEAVAGPSGCAWADRLSVALAVRSACRGHRFGPAPLAGWPAAFSFVPLASADRPLHCGAGFWIEKGQPHWAMAG